MKKYIILIIMIGVAVVSYWAGGRYGKEQTTASNPKKAERKILYYADPMNPGFRSEVPGVAPCGMPLEPVYADAGAGQENAAQSAIPPGAMKINPARQQLIGVKVAPVEIKPMTYSLRLYGRVVPDETSVYRINASTDCWIRELSNVTTGSIVRKNKTLAEALAPAYYNAQVTYLVSLDNIDRIRQQMGGELRHQQTDLADNQIRAAVQALQNLGISNAQIEELANTRKAHPYLQVRSPVSGVVLSRNLSLYQWLKAGEEFYSIADIGKVWVIADLYENEARYLRPGMMVSVSHGQMGKTFNARVSDVLPLFDSISKTLKVRLEIDNPDYELRPDMFVDVNIPITMPESMHVTADAVIDSGKRTIVYVDAGDGIFEPRRVETGWRLGRQVQITEGLVPGEKVVVSGNFLIDSESRMKCAASGIEDEKCKDPVCGMYPKKSDAETAGRTFRHAGKTYYFCSDHCVQVFAEEPGKYITDEHTSGHDAMTGIENGWSSLLKPIRATQGLQHNTKGQVARESQDAAQKSTAGSRGIIDWKTDKSEMSGLGGRDWGVWGQFPGAKYLGLHDAKMVQSEQRQVVPSSGDNKAPGKDPVSHAEVPAQADLTDIAVEDSIEEQLSLDRLPEPAQ